MQRCQNCYNSFMCMSCNPTWYEKHKDEEQTTCLRWEDDSEDFEEE